MIQEVLGREEEGLLRCAIRVSDGQVVASQAWTLRMAMETFSALHFSNKSSIDIHSAAANGFVEQVTILSQLGKLVNQLQVGLVLLLFEELANGGWHQGSYLPLHIAIQRGHRDVAAVLLENHADANCPTADRGQTPLQMAAIRGDVEMSKLLLTHRAATEVTCDTWTALHFAVEHGHTHVARLLIESGADPSPVGIYRFGSDEKSVTPLDIAIESNDRLLLGDLLRFKSIKPERFLTLTKLKLTQVNLEEFPMGLAQMRCLTRLDISCNTLRTIPFEISALASLRDLDLTNTELTEFPKGLCNIKGLNRLVLAGNRIREIPSEVAALVQLERLDLSHNLLAALPQELGHLLRLRKLFLDGNSLHSIPKEVVARGTSRLLEYLRQISGYSADWRKMKLMLVGEECVGKTSEFLLFSLVARH